MSSRSRALPSLSLLLLAAACGGEAPQDPIDPSYEHVQSIVKRSCTFSSSCHGGIGRGSARLNFEIPSMECRPVTDALLVPSSEYGIFQRVEPGDPDRSYVMYKVSGAHDADRNLIFTPDPAWLAAPDAGRYVLRDDAGVISFGSIMPQVAETYLPANDIISIREWIAAGAPHPTSLPGCDGGPAPVDLGVDAGSDSAVDGASMDADVDGASMDAGVDGGPADAALDAPD